MSGLVLVVGCTPTGGARAPKPEPHPASAVEPSARPEPVAQSTPRELDHGWFCWPGADPTDDRPRIGSCWPTLELCRHSIDAWHADGECTEQTKAVCVSFKHATNLPTALRCHPSGSECMRFASRVKRAPLPPGGRGSPSTSGCTTPKSVASVMDFAFAER